MKGYKAYCQFRKYNVPEMLPFLIILHTPSVRREAMDTKKMLVLVAVDLLQFFKGYATKKSIIELTKFPKLYSTVTRMMKEGLIENRGNQQKPRIFTTPTGSQYFRAYEERYRAELTRLYDMGLDLRRL